MAHRSTPDRARLASVPSPRMALLWLFGSFGSLGLEGKEARPGFFLCRWIDAALCSALSIQKRPRPLSNGSMELLTTMIMKQAGQQAGKQASRQAAADSRPQVEATAALYEAGQHAKSRAATRSERARRTAMVLLRRISSTD